MYKLSCYVKKRFPSPLTVRVNENGGDKVAEVSLVCAVTDLNANEFDVILPADVVCKLRATPVPVSVSCCNASDVCDERYETPKVVVEESITEENTLEKVDEVSVTCVEVCVMGRGVKDNDVVKIDDVLKSTPARVSCIVYSDRSEETESTRLHPEPRLESIPPLEESGDRLGAYPGHRDEEVRRIQEMADLGPRRTRSRVSRTLPPTSQKSVPRSVVHVARDVSGRQSDPWPVPA